MNFNRVIYKYIVPSRLVNSNPGPIRIHRGAQVLRCDMQHGNITVWAMVDPSQEMTERWFFVIGTGIPFTNEVEYMDYVGTVYTGNLVFHVFMGEDGERIGEVM